MTLFHSHTHTHYSFVFPLLPRRNSSKVQSVWLVYVVFNYSSSFDGGHTHLNSRNSAMTSFVLDILDKRIHLEYLSWTAELLCLWDKLWWVNR